MKRIKTAIENNEFLYSVNKLGQILVAANRKKCETIYFILTLNINASLRAVTCDFFKILSIPSPLILKRREYSFHIKKISLV